MSIEDDNKAVVGRWFTEFWGGKCNLAVVDEIRRAGHAAEILPTSRVAAAVTSRPS